MSIRKQALRQVKTDEACRAGDEKAHKGAAALNFR